MLAKLVGGSPMNAGIGNVTERNPDKPGRWWLLGPVVLLNLFSAFSFNKFVGAAAYYSARIPITSVTPPGEAVQIAHAHQLADRFFLLFVMLILLATLLMSSIIQLPKGSGRLRLPTRYVLVIVLCILAVGVVAHVFVVYSAAFAALVALLLSPLVQDRLGPDGFRLVARYLLSFVLCIVTTGVLIGMMAFLRL